MSGFPRFVDDGITVLINRRMIIRFDDGDSFANQLLDCAQLLAFIHGAKADGNAAQPCPSRSSDAVHVALGFYRHIVVDHVGDPVDVDAAGGNIGRDQDRNLSLAKAFKSFLACILRFIAMDCGAAESGVFQLPGNPVCTTFGTRKNDGSLDRITAQ